MKKVLFFVLALVIFSCDKKDDPAPQMLVAAGKTITVHITRNDFYPNSTDYYNVESIALRKEIINNDNSTSYQSIEYKSGVGVGPGHFINVNDIVVDSVSYLVEYSIKTSDTTSMSLNNWKAYVPNGSNNTLVDSFYVHTVYE
jgi:hypothetical protein